MSLYHGLVFAILVAELVLLAILGLPLPLKWKKHLVMGLGKPFLASSMQMGIKSVLIFILVLFLDSINKVYNIESELERLKDYGTGIHPQGRLEILSRKFYWQRNMYLTGITLFLTFVLTRTIVLLCELFDTWEKCRDLRDLKKKDPKEAELKQKIDDVDAEIERLKEKALCLQQEL